MTPESKPEEIFGNERSTNYTDVASDEEVEIYHSLPRPHAEPDPNHVEPPT